MLGRKELPKPAALPIPTATGNAATPATILTVVGAPAKTEGMFDIADSIRIECEVGGFFNGSLSKINDGAAAEGQCPVYLLGEKRAGQAAAR